MRVCQIGCGGHASQVYAPALRKLAGTPGLIYVGCCDISAVRAETYRQAAGFLNCYTHYNDMIRQESPDAILLTTPFAVTDMIAADVLRRGIPCLIEKPPAATLEKIRDLSGVAQESGAMHQVAYNRRHMPLIRALREFTRVESIRTIEYRMHRVNRREDHFHTTAVHGFDLVCYLAGSELANISAAYTAIDPAGENPAWHAQFLCEYASGATAALSFAPVSGITLEQISVVTDRALYEADLPVWGARPDGGFLARWVDGKRERIWRDADFADGAAMFESNGFYAQLQAFLDCVSKGQPSPHTLQSSLDSAVLMETMRLRETSHRLQAQRELLRTQ